MQSYEALMPDLVSVGMAFAKKLEGASETVVEVIEIFDQNVL